MFDIGWSEMLLVAVVAIVVIGPKDLPQALRTLGQWLGQLRRAADGFRRQFDDMVREADMDDLRKQAAAMTSLDYDGDGQKTTDPTATGTPETVPNREPTPPGDILPPPGEPVEPPLEHDAGGIAAPARSDAPLEAAVAAEPASALEEPVDRRATVDGAGQPS